MSQLEKGQEWKFELLRVKQDFESSHTWQLFVTHAITVKHKLTIASKSYLSQAVAVKSLSVWRRNERGWTLGHEPNNSLAVNKNTVTNRKPDTSIRNR